MAGADALGLRLSGTTDAALEPYLKAVRELQCFVGDPIATINLAIAGASGFVMAHVFKGYLYGLSTERDAMALARECHAAALALPATSREAAHVTALGHLARGNWHEASRVLEDLSIEYPLDALALQAGHQIDFFTGNARLLRDRIARALPQWNVSMPGYHSVLGMQAFGFEEMGDYSSAEMLGRWAVELEPRDGWAQHAVTHVMEMQCRPREGIAWMRANVTGGIAESFLKTHNAWHLALFHYELGEIDEVLEIYDGLLGGNDSTFVLNLVDASAILWRLHIGGHNVGARFDGLAQRWAPKADAANYAFNDAHAMMAFVGAGRIDLANRLLDAQIVALDSVDDNAAFTRDVGHPLCIGLLRFGEEDYEEAVRLIRPVRPISHRFGGSHAQRDIIDLTLIEAALRSRNQMLARALIDERLATRPDSPLSSYLSERAKSPTIPM